MALAYASEEAIISCTGTAAQMFGVPRPERIVTIEQRTARDFQVRYVKLPPEGASTRRERMLTDIEVFSCGTPGKAYFKAMEYLEKIGGEMPILLRRQKSDDPNARECWAFVDAKSRQLMKKGGAHASASFNDC
jgi:hypothetical protein